MNCILLIIDSLDYTRCQSSAIELLPNLNRRSKDGIRCENMYSQAPYTEAATMAIYCGQNTLDNHGYIERFNNADITLMETFKAAGFETYFNSLQPQCYPTSLRRGIDQIFYNRGYDNEALWNYRFSYYSERANENRLTEIDYKQLIRILDDNFNDWLSFLNNLITENNSVEMIKTLNVDFDARSNLDAVRNELSKYKSDRKEYIKGIFNQGKQHTLFNIPYFKQIDYKISEIAANLYENECASLCHRIRNINFVQNLLFNPDIYKGFYEAVISYLKNHNKKEFDESMYIIRNALIMCNLNKKYGKKSHALKGQPSFYNHINAFLKWIDNRENQDQPYFACIHVDDIHFPEMFYTYDTDNSSLINSELDMATEYLKKRKLNSKGTISLDLSLLYADAKCEYLFTELENRENLDDLMIFVTADHGFSYSGYPVRNKLINTFYLENFKIPFFILGKNIVKRQINSLQSSINIPPTICEIMGVEIPSSFVGHSILDTKLEDDIATIEYCGGGCPDINNRMLMIAAFDKDYMVASLVRLDQPFEIENITEVYNLKTDPLQRKNLVNKIGCDVLSKYIEKIHERITKICYTNNIFLNDNMSNPL